MMERPIDWAVGKKSGLVFVGSHKLYLYASGPDRKPGEPVVIIIQGLASSIKGWASIIRLITPFIRTYSYDRSGFGKSDSSPETPTSKTIVTELDLLLKNANIKPPYIIVAHSWGGILSREFIALRPNDVAGLVLVEGNQERTLDVLDWRDPTLWAIVGKLDHHEVTGVKRSHKLTGREWRSFLDDERSPKHQKQAVAERAEYEKSFKALIARQQLNRTPPLLGDRPVHVVLGCSKRDWEKLYAAGVKAGNGTEQERASFLEILRTWEEKDKQLQLEQLSLSSKSRCIAAGESGHSVHLTQPEVIMEALKWVLNECGNHILDFEKI